MPDVAAIFPVTATTPPFVSGSLTALSSGVHKGSGSISIDGGNITKFQWIVINAPTATVTINHDINYINDTMHSISDIPQVVIIANNINIADTVKNIDAWLITPNGSINTCSSVHGTPLAVDADLLSGICEDQLLVNGPVMTSKLYLRRTFGSSDASSYDKAAETFNLRADAYLWAMVHTASSGGIKTEYSTELPPRF
jgi:hypothetical protein